MFTIHATRKLLDRTKQKPSDPVDEPSTAMGNWYANLVPGRPQIAIFVNENTLVPVLVPAAPAKTIAKRFVDQLAAVLEALDAPADFIDTETAAMDWCGWSTTRNRSVVGSMNDFVFLAQHHRQHSTVDVDLVGLSVRLAGTPCSPLDRTHGFPDRALAALIARD